MFMRIDDDRGNMIQVTTNPAKRVMKEIEQDRRKVKQGLMGGGGLMSGYQPGQAGMMGALVLRRPPVRKYGGQR